ncbi:MAG: hypothetical protein JRI68_22985, partial [Deltaproteobacteria bacterium]|nr:hypothetical protein [Deltaproteobacteria bacterium]
MSSVKRPSSELVRLAAALVLSGAAAMAGCSGDDETWSPAGGAGGTGTIGGNGGFGAGVGGLGGGITGPLGDPGYHARPCGFDLNDDGNVGEPEDCTLCDGTT